MDVLPSINIALEAWNSHNDLQALEYNLESSDIGNIQIYVGSTKYASDNVTKKGLNY